MRENLADAARYWERRRPVYNFVLVLVAVGWLVATWPHFRAALTLSSFLVFAVLALLANVCYCTAYLVDVPIQRLAPNAAWRQHRWGLWWFGTLLAIVLENYWIADEIYPFVH